MSQRRGYRRRPRGTEPHQAQRRGFVSQMIEFAICETAQEANDAAVTPETTAHPVALWAMAWRARSAAWMIRHRRILETAVNR